jgi:protein-S-isoprenylcysteine O-methyltransferase Ste14
MRRKLIALCYGTFCHLCFLLGVFLMGACLYRGFDCPWLSTATDADSPVSLGSFAWNSFLVLQFPILHSFFLGTRGRRYLSYLAPRALRAQLGTTLYASFASLQLILVFSTWRFSGVIWFDPEGAIAAVMTTLFACSWVLLLVSMREAGLGVQTGSLGWFSVFRGAKPKYPSFPSTGLHGIVRHPIYLSFALIMWTAPVWTPDRLIFASIWTVYCAFGPRIKEQRYLQRYPEQYAAYQSETPYLFPLPSLSRFS